MAALVTDPIRYAPVARAYRHWLAGALAVLLHLAVIGGMASRPFVPSPPAPAASLDVVLVTRESPAPVAADALAEAAQQAVGEGEEAASAEARPAAPQAPPPAAASPVPEQPQAAARDTAPERDEQAEPPATEAQREAGASPDPRESAPPPAEPSAPPAATAPAASGRDLLAQATSSIREQGFAPGQAGEASGQPRSAAQQAAEARYIDDWTRRVEDYGNRVHPAPAQLAGQLRIRVVIGRDGQVRRAEVIQSSGHAELDQAALNTVHDAAPYRPFDRGMGHRDSLSITRVWRFGEGNHYGVR